MKAIIDSRHNLARGFADLETPSEVEKELLFTWQEKKEQLKYEIEKLTNEAFNEFDKGKKNTLINDRAMKVKALAALGAKINKRVDLSLLLIDRLKQICSNEDFRTACVLARDDKARILSRISIDDD